MPTLNWIGKEYVINHHHQVPLHLLHCDRELSFGDPTFDLSPGTGNLLVEGDNLLALKALLPFYKGQIKCIYIDPPYNTGNNDWVYNDNSNAPQLSKWLSGELDKKRANVDKEDLTRHDKWLCMMYPRLQIHHDLLRDDGAIFISIDDNEVHHLRAICDEIFGASNFVAQIIWQKRYSVSNDHKTICPMHDYILVYARSELWQRNLLTRPEKADKQYRFYDDNGLFRVSDYTCNKSADERPNLYYPIINPNTGEEIWPRRTRVWAYAKDQHAINVENDLVWWGRDGQSSIPGFKRYKDSLRGNGGVVPSTWWPQEEVGHNDEAKKEVLAIFPEVPQHFPTPKPTRLIRRILELSTQPGDIVLDSFAGSATTGHAVLQMNAADGGNRRFVLIEMEPEVARPVARERLARAIAGYSDQEGLGGGFRYCHLGVPFLDEFGAVHPAARWKDLAHFVYLKQFGAPLDASRMNPSSGYIGSANGISLFLLAGENGVSPLDMVSFRKLEQHPGTKIVYCSAVRIPAVLLDRANILARQAPYEVGQ